MGVVNLGADGLNVRVAPNGPPVTGAQIRECALVHKFGSAKLSHRGAHKKSLPPSAFALGPVR